MEFLKGERKHILYSILLGLAGGLVGVALFGLSGYMISLSFFEPPFFVIILIIAVIKLFGMMKGAFRYIERLLSHDATFRMIGRLRLDYFRHAIRSDEETHSVKFIQRLNEYFEQVENYYIRIIYPYIVAALLSLIILVLSLFFGPLLAVMTGAVALMLLVVIPKAFERFMRPALEDRSLVDEGLYQKLYHYIHDFTDLWVTKRTSDEREKLADGLSRVRHNEDRVALYEAGMQFIAQLIQIMAVAAVILLLYRDAPLLVPMVMLLLLSYFDLVMPVMKPASQYSTVREAVTVLTSDEAARERPEVHGRVDEIEVSDLDFRYENTSLDALTDISLRVGKGEKHAIIGSSGSGKTTLLERIISADEAVTVRGQDARIPHETLISQAAIMPQNLDFYNATIMDNITLFGHIDVTRTQVEAHLDSLELGHYAPETEIHFTGMLSGGEQKRLHFIRMLAEDRKWWIMDEPTARLDDRLKQKIWDHILEQDTLIVSTHDLSRLDAFDRIHYMERGTIIESGSYSELMKNRGAVYEAVQRFNDYL